MLHKAAQSRGFVVQRELTKDLLALGLETILQDLGHRREETLRVVGAEQLEQRTPLSHVALQSANERGTVRTDLASHQIRELAIVAYEAGYTLVEPALFRVEPLTHRAGHRVHELLSLAPNQVRVEMSLDAPHGDDADLERRHGERVPRQTFLVLEEGLGDLRIRDVQNQGHTILRVALRAVLRSDFGHSRLL